MTKLGVVRLFAIRLSISSKRKNRPSSISSGANLMSLCSATHRNVCTNSRSTSLAKTCLYNSSGLSAQRPSSSNVSLSGQLLRQSLHNRYAHRRDVIPFAWLYILIFRPFLEEQTSFSESKTCRWTTGCNFFVPE